MKNVYNSVSAKNLAKKYNLKITQIKPLTLMNRITVKDVLETHFKDILDEIYL